MIISDFANSPDENICSWHVYDKDKCFFYQNKEEVIKAHGKREILECHLEWKDFTDKWIIIIYLV